MVKRPPKGLLANLWEFPTVEVAPEDSRDARRSAMLRYLSSEIGLSAARSGGVACMERALSVEEPLKHVFSHIDQTLHVQVLAVTREEVAGDGDGRPELRWLDGEQVAAAAVPTQMRKVFRAAEALISHGGKNKGKRNRPSSAEKNDKMSPIMERFLLKRVKREKRSDAS